MKKDGKDALMEMEDAVELFKDRQTQYGSAYKRGGEILHSYFPDGVTLKTVGDFERFNVFVMCMLKLNRYASNIPRGGHLDSAQDLIVYASMLAEMTDEGTDTAFETIT